MQRLIASTKALRRVLATNCRLTIVAEDGLGNYQIEATIDGTKVRDFLIKGAPDWQTALQWAKQEVSNFLKDQVGYGIANPELN